MSLGHPRLHLRRTDSTNDRARALALAGAPHGTLVSADAQTAGRGRQGRRWIAPARSSLLMSLILRGGAADPSGTPNPAADPSRTSDPAADPSRTSDPAADPSRTPNGDRPPAPLPLLAAVAVCDVAGPDARVKWPNDIVVTRGEQLAKLAGILVEGRPQEGWAVLGIGLNVAVRLEELPAELRRTAATLGRQPADIEPTLRLLLLALQRRLGDPVETILHAWRARDALNGRQISWDGGHGRAEGIDGEGRLLVTRSDGTSLALQAGEVHLHRPR